MILQAYHDDARGLSVNIIFDFESGFFTITRNQTKPATHIWKERTKDKNKAEAIANNFINLPLKTLTQRIINGESIAK